MVNVETIWVMNKHTKQRYHIAKDSVAYEIVKKSKDFVVVDGPEATGKAPEATKNRGNTETPMGDRKPNGNTTEGVEDIDLGSIKVNANMKGEEIDAIAAKLGIPDDEYRKSGTRKERVEDIVAFIAKKQSEVE